MVDSLEDAKYQLGDGLLGRDPKTASLTRKYRKHILEYNSRNASTLLGVWESSTPRTRDRRMM